MPLEYANCIGAGGLYSTAEDLCRFGMTFTDSGNEILSKKSVKAMMEEQSSELPWDALENRDRFGLGFDTVKKHPFHEYGIQVISKGGSTTSYGSFLAVVPEYNLVMAFMSNGGNPLACHLENNESPYDGVKREVLEETGYIVDIENLISVYSAPQKDDIVFLFKARIKGKIEWEPNSEIQQIEFFERDALPSQIHQWNIKRINDAYDNKISNLWVFE